MLNIKRRLGKKGFSQLIFSATYKLDSSILSTVFSGRAWIPEVMIPTDFFNNQH
jgi:hypothetical protein